MLGKGHFFKLRRAKLSDISVRLKIWSLLCSELSTLPSHTYGKECRPLVMHIILRLFSEKGFLLKHNREVTTFWNAQEIEESPCQDEYWESKVVRNCVVFSDKGVSFAIQKGISASRSKVYWFEHNDMYDLECKLKEQEEKDKKVTHLIYSFIALFRSFSCNRVFFIVVDINHWWWCHPVPGCH